MNIKSGTQAKWDKLFEPIAIVTGATEPNRFILVAGHYDAYGAGATENAVGNAVCLELAEYFRNMQTDLKKMG